MTRNHISTHIRLQAVLMAPKDCFARQRSQWLRLLTRTILEHPSSLAFANGRGY